MKFKIGDLVYLKQDAIWWNNLEAEEKKGYGRQKPPMGVMVLEMLAQTCPGGTQYHYKIRLPNLTEATLHEIELTDKLEQDKTNES